MELASKDARIAQALVTSGKEAELRSLQARTAVSTARAEIGLAQANRSAALSHLTALAGSPVVFTSLAESLGDAPRVGETVAVIESREAAAIAADRSVAAAKASLADKKLARESYLYQQKVSPRADLEEAQAEAASAAAETRRAAASAAAARVSADGRSVSVTSPISGRLTSATASLGAFVQTETELFRVADPSRIQLEAAVSAVDAARVSAGDRATVELADGSTRAALVRAVTPSLNPETRSATVVATLVKGGAQTPGQLVRIRLAPRDAGAGGPSPIVVPEEAVQTLEGRSVVFLRTPNGFRAQAVLWGGVGGRVWRSYQGSPSANPWPPATPSC